MGKEGARRTRRRRTRRDRETLGKVHEKEEDRGRRRKPIPTKATDQALGLKEKKKKKKLLEGEEKTLEGPIVVGGKGRHEIEKMGPFWQEKWEK